MAFTTELVALAGSNGIGDMVTAERTTGGNTGVWSSNFTLPPGTWYVIVRGRATGLTSTTTAEQRLRIDGSNRFAWTPNDGSISIPTATAIDVVGGRDIVIEHTAGSTNQLSQVLGGSQGWDFIAIRTG